MNRFLLPLLLLIILVLAGCQHTQKPEDLGQQALNTPGSKRMGTLTLTSPAFQDQGLIPSRFTCDGLDINPTLNIAGVPEGTVSLVLIVDDPDAPIGNWDHWIVWNIGPNTKDIFENSVPLGSVQGQNDFKRVEYGGPCPPSGTHRYQFKLYALDIELDLPPSVHKKDVEAAMQEHILDEAELIGRYKRV